MAYNKRQKLNDNIEAIRIAFLVEKENRPATADEQAQLRKYSGFGGLKFIMNPVSHTYDEQGGRWLFTMQNSVLSAFYTPDAVIHAVSQSLKTAGVQVSSFLDPSSGNGRFLDIFREDYPAMHAEAFEKDLLTGKILKALHPEDQVIVNGFETIGRDKTGRYDLVSSNIPFGDMKVFDPAFQDSDIRKFASNTLHNYFFLKALDTVRDGGLVAFITSRGVMDSRSYTSVRMEMLRHARLGGVHHLAWCHGQQELYVCPYGDAASCQYPFRRPFARWHVQRRGRHRGRCRPDHPPEGYEQGLQCLERR